MGNNTCAVPYCRVCVRACVRGEVPPKIGVDAWTAPRSCCPLDAGGRGIRVCTMDVHLRGKGGVWVHR